MKTAQECLGRWVLSKQLLCMLEDTSGIGSIARLNSIGAQEPKEPKPMQLLCQHQQVQASLEEAIGPWFPTCESGRLSEAPGCSGGRFFVKASEGSFEKSQ